MLLDEVHNYLAGLSPTLGLIVKGTMPATPDVCLSLFEYGGAPANMGFNVAGVQHEMPGLQVVTRKIGETIELTPEAAAHLLARGLVEHPGSKPKVKES